MNTPAEVDMIEDKTRHEGAREELVLIYSDLAARLVNDNSNSWQIIALSGALLAFLGTPLFQNPPLGGLSQALGWGAGAFFMLSITAALISLLVVRDLPEKLRTRLLLGKEGMKILKVILEIWKGGGAAAPPLFHTSAIMERGPSLSSRRRYISEVKDRFEEDLADYIFFLAYLVEIKKKPRVVSLFSLFFGGLCLLVLIWFR